MNKYFFRYNNHSNFESNPITSLPNLCYDNEELYYDHIIDYSTYYDFTMSSIGFSTIGGLDPSINWYIPKGITKITYCYADKTMDVIAAYITKYYYFKNYYNKKNIINFKSNFGHLTGYYIEGTPNTTYRFYATINTDNISVNNCFVSCNTTTPIQDFITYCENYYTFYNTSYGKYVLTLASTGNFVRYTGSSIIEYKAAIPYFESIK